MQHLAYNVRYSVMSINSSLLTTTLFSSVITTLVYNDTQYSAPFMTLWQSSTVYDARCDYIFISIVCICIKNEQQRDAKNNAEL